MKLSDGTVNAAGRDEDGGHGADRMAAAVQFDLALALEDDVDLGVVFVEVWGRFALDCVRWTEAGVLGSSRKARRAQPQGQVTAGI